MPSKVGSAILETGKHAAIYGIGGMVPQLVGFALLPIFARFLSPEEFGIWALLQSLSALCVSLLTLGLDTSCLRSYFDYEDPDTKRKVIGSTLSILLIGILLFTAGSVAGAPWISAIVFKSLDFASYIQLIILIIGFKSLNTIPYVIFRAQKKSISYISIESISGVIRFATMSYILLSTKWGVLGLLYIDLATSAAVCIALYFCIRREFRFAFSIQEIRKLLSYGVPLVPSRFFYSMITFSDRYLLSLFLSLSAVGVYSIAMKVSQIMPLLLVQPFQLIFPAMAFELHGEQHDRAYYSRIFTYFLFIGTFLSLCIAMYSEEIILLISKDGYREALDIIPILLIGFLFSGLRLIVQIPLFTHKKTLWVPGIVAGGAIINVLLNIGFIMKFGIIGAAVASLFTQVAMLAAYYVVSSRYLKIPYEWKRIMKMAVFSILIFFIGRYYHPAPLLYSAMFKLLLLAGFPLGLYFLNFYTPGEKENFFHALRHRKLFLKRLANSK